VGPTIGIKEATNKQLRFYYDLLGFEVKEAFASQSTFNDVSSHKTATSGH
jgi:hypothetical protein